MFINECNPIKWGGKESISLGPVKTQSSSKSLKSPERTVGNKPKTNLVSNSSISNFRQTGILSKLMQHRGPNQIILLPVKFFISYHSYSLLEDNFKNILVRRLFIMGLFNKNLLIFLIL